jgi:hypothetical protein
MKVFYDCKKNRLVYLGNDASSEYWDKHWLSNKDFKWLLVAHGLYSINIYAFKQANYTLHSQDFFKQPLFELALIKHKYYIKLYDLLKKHH